MKYGSFLIIYLFAFYSLFANTTNIQDLNILSDTAREYAISKITNNIAGRRIVVTAGKLDPRLRLVSCNGLPHAFTPPGSRLQGNTTIGIRCDSPKPWSIYVSVKIAIFETVIVTTTKMSRGDIISESDIAVDEVDISRLRGRSFSNKLPLIGTKVKTNMKINQVIDSATICLICKGDTVLITANNSAVSVSVSGIALSDGGKGDKIRVQNNASRRIVDAIVTNLGTVTVGI